MLSYTTEGQQPSKKAKTEQNLGEQDESLSQLEQQELEERLEVLSQSHESDSFQEGQTSRERDRCLDRLARLIQGRSSCVAAYIDSEETLFCSSNDDLKKENGEERENTKFINKILEYFQNYGKPETSVQPDYSAPIPSDHNSQKQLDFFL